MYVHIKYVTELFFDLTTL